MTTIAENIQTLRSIKSDIKNAIIQKGGSVTDAFGTYAQAITNLPSGGGGGTEIEDGLITRTLSGTYYNDRISMVGNYAFVNCYVLSSVNLPNCEYIGDNAFSGCGDLSFINIPLCTSLMNSAFLYCYKLQSISLPNCSYFGYGAFKNCSMLPSVNLPLCKSFSEDMFGNCETFASCSALSIVKIPLGSNIGRFVFVNCINLKEVYLNSVSSVTTISINTFSNCPNLTSIYVPSSLVDAFKTARYWSSISDKIVAYTGA